MATIIKSQTIWTAPSRSIKVEAEYQNRTATTVEVRLKTTYKMNGSSGYSGYKAYFTPTINSQVQERVQLKGTTPTNWYGSPILVTTEWYTIDLSSSLSLIPISILFSTEDPDDSDVTKSGSLSCPQLVAQVGTVADFILDTSSIVEVPITIYNDEYYHKLDYECMTEDLSTGSGNSRVITSSGTYQFQFTQTELNNMFGSVYGLKNRNSAKYRFVLYTYSDSTYETLVGYTKYEYATGTITNANPIFSNFTYQDSNTTTKALTGDNSKIILGKSTLKVTISTANKATAQKLADMVSYQIGNVSESYVTTEINKELTNYNANTIKVSAIDSRGNSTEVSKNLTTISYVDVDVDEVNATIERTNDTEDETKISFSGTWWNNNFGTSDNTLSISYKYREAGSTGAYTTGLTTITSTISGNNFSVSDKAILGDTSTGFDSGKSYEIVLTISDSLSGVVINYTLMAGVDAIVIEGNRVIEMNGKTPVEVVTEQTTSDEKAYSCNYINNLTPKISLAKMHTYGNQSVASGATAFVSGWTDNLKIEIGDFICEKDNGRIKIPAGTAKHIKIYGLIAGVGYCTAGCLVVDGSNNTATGFYTQSAIALYQFGGNTYFKALLPEFVFELDDTIDNYVRLNIGGYNGKTFNINSGFGNTVSYMVVEKID